MAFEDESLAPSVFVRKRGDRRDDLITYPPRRHRDDVAAEHAAPSPTTGTLFLLFSFGCMIAKELPGRLRRPRRQESVPPIPTAAVDAYFTVTERGAPCFAGG